MRLPRSRRRAPDDDGLIPMINVVFLLLVFFMAAGTIRPPSPLELEPPGSVQRTEPVAERTLHVAVDRALSLDARAVTLAQLPGALREPVDATNATNATNARGARALAVRADGRLTVEALRDVMAALREAGVEKIDLLTIRRPSPAS